MRGESPEAVATLLLNTEELKGLQGPTVSSVYNMSGDTKAAQHGFYAATICVQKKKLYAAVKVLQKVGEVRLGWRGVWTLLFVFLNRVLRPWKVGLHRPSNIPAVQGRSRGLGVAQATRYSSNPGGQGTPSNPRETRASGNTHIMEPRGRGHC